MSSQFYSPLCCRLSDVRNFVQPNSQGLTFRSISAPADSLGTRAVCVKILDINSRGYMSTVKLSGTTGIKNWRISTNISLHFEKHRAMSSAIPP